MGDAREKYSNAVRASAIAMYLNSCGLRAIGRVLKVSYQLVDKWVEQEILKLQATPRTIAILEMDTRRATKSNHTYQQFCRWCNKGIWHKMLSFTKNDTKLNARSDS